jgi:hypothetical protein
MLDPPQLHALEDLDVGLRRHPPHLSRLSLHAMCLLANLCMPRHALALAPYSASSAFQLWGMFVEAMPCSTVGGAVLRHLSAHTSTAIPLFWARRLTAHSLGPPAPLDLQTASPHVLLPAALGQRRQPATLGAASSATHSDSFVVSPNDLARPLV